MWELFTRQVPWPGCASFEVTSRVANGERNKIPDDCVAKHLINRSWHQDPTERPEFEEIYESLAKLEAKGVNYDAMRLSARMAKYFEIEVRICHLIKINNNRKQ